VGTLPTHSNSRRKEERVEIIIIGMDGP